MSSERRVQVFDDREALVSALADRFVTVISDELALTDAVHVVLTGGSVGIAVLAAIGDDSRRTSLDWDRIHLWWGDERWVPAGDEERNDAQAEGALLAKLSSPPSNIHRFAASDSTLSLDDAALNYARDLAEHAPAGARVPRFALVFLGVGPDGHIASLFPDRDGVRETNATVIAVRNSPKPPPERLSLTLPAINSASRVWLCLAGTDKASALGLALAGASIASVPAAGAQGRTDTTFFVDRDAAAEVPGELLGRD